MSIERIHHFVLCTCCGAMGTTLVVHFLVMLCLGVWQWLDLMQLWAGVCLLGVALPQVNKKAR